MNPSSPLVSAHNYKVEILCSCPCYQDYSLPPPISVAASVEGKVIKHEKFYLSLQFIVSLAITLT